MFIHHTSLVKCLLPLGRRGTPWLLFPESPKSPGSCNMNGGPGKGDSGQQQQPPAPSQSQGAVGTAGTGTESVVRHIKEGGSHGRAPGSLKRLIRNQLIRMQTDTRPYPYPCGCHMPTHTVPSPSFSPLLDHPPSVPWRLPPAQLTSCPSGGPPGTYPSVAAWGVGEVGRQGNRRPPNRESQVKKDLR